AIVAGYVLQLQLIEEHQRVRHDQNDGGRWSCVGAFRRPEGNHEPARPATRCSKSLSERLSVRSINARAACAVAIPPLAPMRVQFSAAIAFENSRASAIVIFCNTE